MTVDHEAMAAPKLIQAAAVSVLYYAPQLYSTASVRILLTASSTTGPCSEPVLIGKTHGST